MITLPVRKEEEGEGYNEAGVILYYQREYFISLRIHR